MVLNKADFIESITKFQGRITIAAHCQGRKDRPQCCLQIPVNKLDLCFALGKSNCISVSFQHYPQDSLIDIHSFDNSECPNTFEQHGEYYK